MVVLVAVVAGGLAGVLEALAALGERFLGGRLWLFGPDLVWLTPLAEAAVFVVLGAVYALLSLVLRPLARPAIVVTVFAGLAALAVLSEVDALHWAAAGLLALGLGSAAARAVPAEAVSMRVRRLGFGVAAFVAITAAAVTGTRIVRERARGSGLRPENAGAPNILLLVLDTVRAWNFGWYGYARNTTPFLDEEFAAGTVFDRALAPAPWTLPSHASMFTGKPPFALSAGWDRPLDDTERTIAETLRAAGYATGGFVGNFRFTGSSTGLTRGFDAYRDYPRHWAEALRMTAFARRLFRVPAVQVWLGSNRIIEAKFADEVNREFFNWVDGVERPFFGFLNYVDAHSPYLPPAPYDSVWTRAAGGSAAQSYAADIEATFGRGPIPAELLVEYLDGYDGALSYLDAQIDSLFAGLERRGRLRNTIVIVTSDHGEFFGEHGLVQHGNALYLPVLHVPLGFWAPGRIPAGVRVGDPVTLQDLAATIVELAGAPKGSMPGHSLAPLWESDTLAVDLDPVLASVDWHPSLSKFPPSPLLDGSLRSLLLDSLHYIRRADGTEELFDLSRDFLETRTLSGAPTYRAELLRARRMLDSLTGGNAGPRADR